MKGIDVNAIVNNILFYNTRPCATFPTVSPATWVVMISVLIESVGSHLQEKSVVRYEYLHVIYTAIDSSDRFEQADFSLSETEDRYFMSFT